MEIIGFEASISRGSLRKQYLEHPSGNPYHTFIFADSDAELDAVSVGVPLPVKAYATQYFRSEGNVL